MIKTSRLRIRELMPDDWQAIQRIAADFGRSRYAVYDMPLPSQAEEIKALTARFAASHLWFAVLLEQVMIGYVCFHEERGIYDLGYCFHSDHHGRGYAYESCNALLENIEKTHPVLGFSAGTALKNTPSCRLLEKLGFALQKTERLSFHQDEAGHDIVFEGGVFYKSPVFSPKSRTISAKKPFAFS